MISHDPVPARSSVMPAPKSESFPTPFKPKLCNEIDHLGAYSFSPTSQMGYPSTLHTRENLASTDNISTPRICNKICNKIRTNETTTRIATRDSSSDLGGGGIIFPIHENSTIILVKAGSQLLSSSPPSDGCHVQRNEFSSSTNGRIIRDSRIGRSSQGIFKEAKERSRRNPGRERRFSYILHPSLC